MNEENKRGRKSCRVNGEGGWGWGGTGSISVSYTQKPIVLSVSAWGPQGGAESST